MMLRVALWWFATAAWAGEVYLLSTASYGAGLSRSLLLQILDAFHVSVSPITLSILNSIVRTLAHLAEYCILGLLLYRSLAWRDRLHWRPRTALGCVSAAGLYALSDEFHQFFVPGRGAALRDCAIDVAGSVLAMIVIYNWCRLSGRGRLSRIQP